MNVPEDTRVRGVRLLHQLRAAVPDKAAERIGLLSEDDPFAIVEAFLYLRRSRIHVPAELYRAVHQQMIDVLEAV